MRTAAAADQCTIHEPLFTYVAIVTIHKLDIFFTCEHIPKSNPPNCCHNRQYCYPMSNPHCFFLHVATRCVYCTVVLHLLLLLLHRHRRLLRPHVSRSLCGGPNTRQVPRSHNCRLHSNWNLLLTFFAIAQCTIAHAHMSVGFKRRCGNIYIDLS